MKTVGIICEYNPFHAGHKKQIDLLKAANHAVVCLMSGNFVQRGAPALLNKSLRARAAVESGADLVLELPVTAALSSAEGFASEGVRILSGFCDGLCFGTETADSGALMDCARVLLSNTFSPALRVELDKGRSFPAARQAALESMGADSQILSTPNNILGVEYCKAMIRQNSTMEPMPILRRGSYHTEIPDPENPSATAVRKLMLAGQNWHSYVPTPGIFDGAALHTLAAGERAVLSRLRTMTDGEFEALPYGSEGLWRKLMHASRSYATLEEILNAAKSKRYTRTRLDRMVMCAFLGITQGMLTTPAPYTRVLAFNDRGREILKKARKTGSFPNIGEKIDHPYQALETRTGELYGLFALRSPEPPGLEAKQRIFYVRK